MLARTRCYSHAALRSKPLVRQSGICIREQLRELLRETAQPVAVVTAFMPNSTSKHHGATLSSFTSIAMDPFPLITFALRLPSRMAASLNNHTAHPHMVINILSSTQANLAHTFSRPDLFPEPFSDPKIPYTLTQEGLPVFDGSLGAMTCSLVGRGLPLHDLNFLANRNPGPSNDVASRPTPLRADAVASELFIAQVTRIEALGWQEDTQVQNSNPPILPLLYHRKRFTSCNPSAPVSMTPED